MASESVSSHGHILVADDNEGITDALALLLEDAGYTVDIASHGDDVPAAITRRPAVVLLDVRLSGADGRDICRDMKNDPQTRDIPVILFTANKDVAAMAKEAGADDYLVKPFEMDELLAMIARLCEAGKPHP